MKKFIVLIVLGLVTIYTFSQEPNSNQLYEYASIYVNVFYQGNTIKTDNIGISRSPTLIMPDGSIGFLVDNTDEKNITNFITVNQILNFMAKYGWVLMSSNITPYTGDSGNNSTSNIINTNEYLQVLIFQRNLK